MWWILQRHQKPDSLASPIAKDGEVIVWDAETPKVYVQSVGVCADKKRQKNVDTCYRCDAVDAFSPF